MLRFRTTDRRPVTNPNPLELRQMVERFYAALSSLKPDDWIALWHEEGIFDQPFPPEPSYPARLAGVHAIYNHVRSIDRVFQELTFHDIVVHTTADPEVVIATLRSEGGVVATGKRYANEYVAFFRIRDGKVVEYREYFNPLKVLEAFGGINAMDTLSESFNIDG
jgi:uncharacterized protein